MPVADLCPPGQKSREIKGRLAPVLEQYQMKLPTRKKHIPQSHLQKDVLLAELSGNLSHFGNLLVLRALQILPGDEVIRDSN